MSYAYLFKYIILGDAGVGKSSLLMQFTERRSQSEMEPTIGVEFGARTVVIDREQIKLQIWDTCGAEMFRAIVRSYYRESAGVLLVYDVTRRESFDNISMWLEEVKKHNHGNLTAILVGNKCDRGSERQVSAEEAQAYAEQQGIMFIETSASTANNVDAAFTVSAKRVRAGRVVLICLPCA